MLPFPASLVSRDLLAIQCCSRASTASGSESAVARFWTVCTHQERWFQRRGMLYFVSLNLDACHGQIPSAAPQRWPGQSQLPPTAARPAPRARNSLITQSPLMLPRLSCIPNNSPTRRKVNRRHRKRLRCRLEISRKHMLQLEPIVLGDNGPPKRTPVVPLLA